MSGSPRRPLSCLVATGLVAAGLAVHAHAAEPRTTAAATPDLPVELVVRDPDRTEAAEAYLREGQLGPAVEVAERAAFDDPLDRRAHLVLARALSAVRVHHPGDVCAWGAWPDRILDHVAAAWALDGAVLDRIETDPALADVREALSNTIALRLWPTRGRAWRPTRAPQAVAPTGLPVLELEGVVKHRFAEPLLTGLTWYGLDPSGQHDDTVLDLRSDGSAIRATVERDADGTKHARYVRGAWSLGRDGLRIQLEDEPAALQVTLAGLQVGEGERRWIRWTDRPVDCTRPFDVWSALPDGT